MPQSTDVWLPEESSLSGRTLLLVGETCADGNETGRDYKGKMSTHGYDMAKYLKVSIRPIKGCYRGSPEWRWCVVGMPAK